MALLAHWAGVVAFVSKIPSLAPSGEHGVTDGIAFDSDSVERPFKFNRSDVDITRAGRRAVFCLIFLLPPSVNSR